MNVRVATRRSALALAQTRKFISQLCALHPGTTVEEIHVVTEGDRIQDRPLAVAGGKGLFVKELESALLHGRADLAVHSMKDLPADLAAGLSIACVPTRASPWDVLVTEDGRGLDALARGARVGTGSLRRRIQLLARRPDLQVLPLRGNIDTRIRRLGQGDFDAIVLAEAGLIRLDVTARFVRLEGVLVPAIAQGALAIETRANDTAVGALLGPLHDADTHLTTTAERSVMRALGGSCVVPMGALARTHDGRMSLDGFYAREDGSKWVSAECDGPTDDPEKVGKQLATTLATRLEQLQPPTSS